MESLSMKESVNLYLDQETRDTFTDEAKQVGLSFSAYLRVVGRVIRAWGESDPSRPLEDLRQEVRRIIKEESRYV